MWPFIHLDELKQVNPDCVGWIHMEGSPINYPVVKQHFDRSYYLAHNFSGEESVHGRVSMDFRHGGRMGERTTVLHAHHMKDWFSGIYWQPRKRIAFKRNFSRSLIRLNSRRNNDFN